MNADADYAGISQMLSKAHLPAFVSYEAMDRINGLGNDQSHDHIAVRVADGKVVSGSSHVSIKADSAPTTHWVERTGDGIFLPNRNLRISAVLYYNRREFVGGSSKRYPNLVAFHNRFASKPLPLELCRGLGNITQYQYVQRGNRVISETH